MATTIGTVTLSKNPSYSSEWHKVRYNQEGIETADAGRVTYDNGPSVIKGTLIIKSVSATEAGNLRTWLDGTAIYGKVSFTITPPSNTNIGGGAGVALTSCYFDGGASDDGVFTLVPPGLYDIEFPYWKKV